MKIPRQNWATAAAATAFFIAATAYLIATASPHPGRAAEEYPDPEAELKSFKVAEGYEVNLFAAEPMIGPPIQIQFDPAGRLWVVCSWTYPQLVPGEKPNDKVIILEDTDEDGKADKATDFATGLMHPTGIALGGGGAYVGQARSCFTCATPTEMARRTRRAWCWPASAQAIRITTCTRCSGDPAENCS